MAWMHRFSYCVGPLFDMHVQVEGAMACFQLLNNPKQRHAADQKLEQNC